MKAASERLPLATEQVLALAMARHERLGAESLARHLDVDALECVLHFVRAAHEHLASTKRVVSICVRTGHLVDRVELHKSDGTFEAAGGHGGRWRRPKVLQLGEYITGIGGRKGDGLDSVWFRTSLGNIYAFTGGANGGLPFSFTVPNDHEVQAFNATSGGLAVNGMLLSIDNVESRVSPWSSAMAKLLLAHPNRDIFNTRSSQVQHRVGALAAGNNIEIRILTFEEAKRRMLELPDCAGFTFGSAAPRFHGTHTVFFKNRRDGNNDWRWQSWLKADWNGSDPPPTDWAGNSNDGPGYDPLHYTLYASTEH